MAAYCALGRERWVPGSRVCVSCQRQDVPCPFGAVAAVVASVAEPAVLDKPPKRKEPNKTEAEYQFRLGLEFPGHVIRFEPITLHLDNGHAYTADWVVYLDGGGLLLVEVKARGKNGFRHPSYQRARVMFDQSRLEYPQYRWRWAEKHLGSWSVFDY